MMSAMGEPQSTLLVGGTSEIGQAIVRAMAGSRLERVVLTARQPDQLPNDIGGVQATAIEMDICNPDEVSTGLDTAFSTGDIDLAVIATGVLGDQVRDEGDPEAAAQVLRVTGVETCRVTHEVFERMKRQGHGTLVVLSSVAAVRARRANFVYGSAKAMLDAFAQGLAEVGTSSGVRVVVVRPGFVRTRMTEGMAEAPFTVDPDDVAADVARGLRRHQAIIHSPQQIGLVAAGLRVMPRPLLRRLPR